MQYQSDQGQSDENREQGSIKEKNHVRGNRKGAMVGGREKKNDSKRQRYK